MYIIDRLIGLLSKSDPDSSDYILASCFLDRSTFINEKVTLAEIEKKTFISKSSTNRFVRACGASTLKSFCASLRKEYEEDTISLKKEINDTSSLTVLSSSARASIRNTAAAVMKAKRVFFYGPAAEIMMFSDFMHACIHLGIQPLILDDWPISQIRKKICGAEPDDILFFIETGYSLQMLEIRMALFEEVIQYSELSSFAGTKVFIGKKSAENDGFTVIDVPQSADRSLYLKQISQCILERMWSTR